MRRWRVAWCLRTRPSCWARMRGLSREGLEEISVHSAAASLLATSTTRTRERSLLPRAMLRLGLVQAATVVVVVCVALALAQVNPNVYPRTRVFDTSSGPVQGAYSISQ